MLERWSAQVLVNRGSGAGDKGALVQQIEMAFKEYGWRVEFIPLERRILHRQIQQAVAQTHGTVVVAGGDGTISAVAAACARVDRPLGIVPAGTFNYIARNLGIPQAVAEAVGVIAAGRLRAVDGGEVNGRLFLNNAGFGLYARMIERRERDKRRYGRNRLVACISGLLCLLSAHPLYVVDLVVDGRAVRRRTTTLFFGCNALQLEQFNIAAADCLRHRHLAVLSLQLHGRWQIARAACAALVGRLDRHTAAETFCARTVHVQTRRRRLPVAIDGEVVRLRPPLEVCFRPSALQVFAPAVEAR
jgi:diacylglycerol kinase family enzyme